MIDPYAHIAAIYDAEFASAEGDVSFFARHAARGPLLVLGCGTGRVCRPLAVGRAVTGLDRSEPMIRRARELGGDVTYVVGDMTSFDLGTFGEIVVPNAAFSFLPTRRDQQACLAACHRALSSGAPLTLDLPMPDFRWLGDAHTPEKPAWDGVVGGRAVRRTREVRREPVAQRLTLIDRYYDGDVLLDTSTLVLRLVFPGEVEWMLEACGFWVDAVYGDHAGNPLREGCPRLLVRAIRA